MARTYKRDARGRFAGGGYSGQTGGRGARLTAKGTRKGGGAKISAARPGGTAAKPRGLKPDRWISKQRVIGKGEVWVGRYRNPGGKARKAAAAKAKARKISDAKASRIVARVDARRPALRAASGSARRNQNAVNTYRRATDFLLAPSRRALKRGSQISANDSVRRAVANAKPTRRR